MLHARTTVFAGLLGLVACSSEPPPPAVVNQAPVLAPVPEPGSATCNGASSPRAPGSSCVGIVRGQLIDSADAPVSSPISVCGGGVLCMGSAADEGLFQVTVNRFVDLGTFALWVYGYPNHAEMIVPLHRAATTDVTLTDLPRVPRFDTIGDVLPATSMTGGVFRSGPVELTLPAGTSTVVKPAHENLRGLAVGAVPDRAKWGPNLVALFALGPPSARFSPNVGIALTLPDPTAFADGTSLDLVILDDEILGGHPGTLVTVGSTTVTKGVARGIAGTTLDRLTWIGVRVPQGK